MNTLKQTLYAVIKGVIGSETLVFAEQNAPRPALPYWTIKLQSIRSTKGDYYSQGVDNTGNQKIRGTRDLTVAVQRYGDDSEIVLENFLCNVCKTTVFEEFSRNNIALYNKSDVMHAPVKLDNNIFEDRAAADLFFRVDVETLDNVGIINTVSTGSEFIDHVDLDQTITAP